MGHVDPEQRVQVGRHRDDPVAQRVGAVAGAVPVGHGDRVADGEAEAVRGVDRGHLRDLHVAEPLDRITRAGPVGPEQAELRVEGGGQRRVGAGEEAQLGAGGEARAPGPHRDGPLGRGHRAHGGASGLLDDQREVRAPCGVER